MEISSQVQLRKHGQPSFCYLCGESLAGPEPTDRDHCPPKGLFAPGDRVNFPVILPAHRACNNRWHGVDDLVGILTDALHSRKRSQDESVTKRLDALALTFNGKPTAAVSNVPLDAIALRIVRGMHALLYKTYLPLETPHNVHIPLPSADAVTGELFSPPDQAFIFSREVGRALQTRTAESIVAYSGHFRYACVWDHLDNGVPFCMYAFDIYAFHYLSPPVANFPRCFVGMYVPRIVPQSASWASKLEFSVSGQQHLDPWLRT